MPSNHSTREHTWSPSKGLARATAYGAIAGVVVGLLYFAMTWFLQDSIRANESLGYITWRGPMRLFCVLSLVLGWCVPRLLERFCGMGGSVLFLPLVVLVLMAFGLAFLLCTLLINSFPASFGAVFLVSGVITIAVAGFVIKLAS